jgi:uridine monophosphate synthetase
MLMNAGFMKIKRERKKSTVKFGDKLNQAQERNHSLLCVALDPDPEAWPKSYGSWEGISSHLWGLQEWLQFLMAETADLVCAYKLTTELYQVLGTSGLKLLRQTLKAIPPEIPVILDAKHSGLNTSSILARTIFSDWQVDAVTLNPYTGQDEVAPFLLYPDKAVFILCATANPSAAVLQEYPSPESPFYLQLVREAKTWGTPEQVGLEVGGNAEVWARIRSVAPERLILARDIPSDSQELKKMLEVELNANGEGLILPVPPEILARESPRKSIQALRAEINQVRVEIAQDNPTCSLWLPDVCLLQSHPHKDLILQLYDIGCLHFGQFVQASGATLPY